MTKTLLPTVTLELCASITGMTGNHAAHVVFSTLNYLGKKTHHPIGNCPGKHEHTSPAVPADPFHGIDDSDRDL